MQTNCFDAVILDMDGLLLATEATYFMAWQKAVQQQGYALNDTFYLSLSGVAFSQLEQSLLKHLGADFDFSQFCQQSSAYWQKTVEQHGIALNKGVLALLNTLCEYQIPYCLASNSPEKNAYECLHYAGIADYFSSGNVVCLSQNIKPKPAADIFLKAAGLLKKSITHCLIFEDSSVGAIAANNAGSPAILIPSQADINYQKIGVRAVFEDLELCLQALKLSPFKITL